MSDPKPQVVIPFVQGLFKFARVPPQEKALSVLSGGRYLLHSLCTVPVVRVQWANGQQTVTWGEVVEIPTNGAQGAVFNESYHTGDIYFQGVGTGAGASVYRPGAVTIPVEFVAFGTAPNDGIRTKKIDTRLAKRAYFWRDGAGQNMQVSIVSGGERGMIVAPNSSAASSKQGNPSFTANINTYSNNVSLGYGTNQNQEPSPNVNTLAELRAMALLDWVYLEWTAANATAAGITVNTDAFVTMEY